jgi:hypothetical protein
MGFIYWYLLGDCLHRIPEKLELFFLSLDEWLWGTPLPQQVEADHWE